MFALSAKKMALFRNADLSNFERKRSTRLVEDIGVSVKKKVTACTSLFRHLSPYVCCPVLSGMFYFFTGHARVLSST